MAALKSNYYLVTVTLLFWPQEQLLSHPPLSNIKPEMSKHIRVYDIDG